MKTNPNKWLFDENDITIICSTVEGIALELEIGIAKVEGKVNKELAQRKVNSLNVAVRALKEMNEQQIYLARAIEVLKHKLK